MAYGTKYYAFYKSGNTQRSIFLQVEGHTGPGTEWFCSATTPVEEKGSSDSLFGDVIVPTVVRMEFLFEENYDLTEFVAEPRTYKVVIQEDLDVIFEGFVEPYDTYHNYQKPRYFVSMTASCGLNRLSKNIFQQTEFNEGNLTLNYFELVQRCLQTIGIERDIRVSLYTQLNSSLSAPNPLLSVEVNVFRYFVDGAWMDCQTIVADILNKFNAQLFLDQKTWVIRSFIDHDREFNGSYVFPIDGVPYILPYWDVKRSVNYLPGEPLGSMVTLKGSQVSLTPRVRKYTTNVDLGGKNDEFVNGGLQLWDANGPVGWVGNMGPALGGIGWTKVETGLEGAPYALHIRGFAPHPYFKRKKKGIWPFRKTVVVALEPEVYWETPEIEIKKTDETLNIGFEYFTEADSAGFLYTVTLFRSQPVDGEVNRVYVKPDVQGFPYSDEYQLLIAPPHPKVNPETGITQSKGKIDYSLNLVQLNTKYLTGPDQPYFDRAEIWFYFSNQENGKSGDEYTIYKIISDKTGSVESEAPDGDSRYKVVLESNPYESDEGAAINLITGDYSEGFLGTTMAMGSFELEPTKKWMRRDRSESISIYRAMLLDRLAVTYEVADVIQADVYVRSGEELRYLHLLLFEDRNLLNYYKIVRYSFNHVTRIASILAVEVNYVEPENIKQRSYTDARGLLDESAEGGDGTYPGTGTPSGRIGAEEDELFEEEPTEEELANARTGIFEDVPSLVYTVNEQATRYLDLEEYLSEFYIEGEFEDDIEEEDRHDPLNFVLSVVNKPSWLTSVTFDGLLITATAKPTVVGNFVLELSVVDDTFGIVPNVKIPIIVYPKTSIKYTLRDTSGTEPLGVGEITNGSGFLKPDTWDILVQVKGHHEGWYGKLTGMGIDVQPSPDPYALTPSTDEATYIIGYNIDSEVGIYNLVFATYRDEGEPDNLKLVKRDKIRFTLYDETYLNKAAFELWGAESGTLIGPINPNGSSAFNVEEAWDVKMIIDGVEHDAGTSVLGSEAGDLDTLTIGPLDPTVTDASYFQFGEIRNEFTPDTYNVLLTLNLEGAEQYVRAASFTINKEKVKPVGGKLQLVSMVPNTTNYDVMGVLAINGNLFTLPTNGWNVLLESEVPAGTTRKHQLLQKKGSSLVNINTSVYTGVSEVKEYLLAVDEDQYFIFDDFSSKDIGKIHVTPSSFRVIITDEVDGEVTNIYQADFSFGTLEDLDDLEISEPGNSGDGTQEYYAGRGLSEIVDDYIKTFNVNTDNVTLEIFDQTNPLVNWLRIKDKGVAFAKMQDIPTLSLIGKLTAGTGTPYAVPVLNGASAVAASDTSIGTTLWVKNQLTGTVSGLAGRLAKFSTNTTLTYSILEESGIALIAQQGVFVSNNASNTNVRGFVVQEDGKNRFSFGKQGTPANFQFWRWDDLGTTLLGTPLSIERATGKITLETQLTIQGSSLAPLVVSSTILVTNFNADLLDGQHGPYYLDRANHTGTQLASTISNFSPAVLATTLTGLSTSNSSITSSDTILQAFGKIQGQITGNISGTTGRIAKFTGPNAIGASILEESGISLIARQGIFVADNTSNTNVRGFVVQEGGQNRFSFGKQGTGADFAFWRYADDGVAVLGTPISIERSTGKVTLETQLTIQGSSLAPLVVSSSALVTNFNADLLDGQHGAYYLDWNNLTNKKSIIAGAGMTGGGLLDDNRTITLGTPATLTNITTNDVSGTTHSHAIQVSNLVAGSNISLSASGTGVILGPNNITISATSMPWPNITSKPTTIDGFGITDGVKLTDFNIALNGKENTFSKGSLIAGTGIALSGTLTDRLVGTGNVTISFAGFSGTAGYIPQFGSGGTTLVNSVIRDTGTEINVADTRSFGVEGPAAMRDYLHVWGYQSNGTASNHGSIVVHNQSSATPHSSAAIEIRSTSKALLISRMTYAQKTAIGYTEGLLVYQTNAATDTSGGTAPVGLYYSTPLGWVRVAFDYLQPG